MLVQSGALLLLIASCMHALSMRAPRSGISRECDVVVIGAGLGGLSCASVLSSLYGQHVQIFEAHYHSGGCAHSFPWKSKKSGFTYNFDSGPTITLGCSAPPFNPLAQVLKAVGGGDMISWISYDRWGMVTESGNWPFILGEEKFEKVLRQFAGPSAVEEFRSLRQACAPLCAGAAAIPTMALRSDKWKLLPLLPHLDALKKVIPYADVLNGNFEPFLEDVRDPWFRSWLDALAFSLSGLPAGKTGAATMAYTLFDLHRDGATLDYPRGGFGAIAAAFQRVVTESGSDVHLSTPVSSIAVEGGRAVGVILSDGTMVKAKRGVVCNANIWALPKLLQNAAVTGKLNTRQHVELIDAPKGVTKTKSFSHLHLGIDATGLDRSQLLPHYTVMDQGLHCADPCADRNMVAVSNPSLLDPSLVLGAEGASDRLMIHAYTAGNEPWEPWGRNENGDKNVYDAAKKASCEVLYRSVSRALGISRDELARRTDVQLLGSPHTHKRFLLRDEGTYGAEFGSMLAGPTTTLPGLFLTGDSTFPGIGVPAVAVSGTQAANTMVSVARHLLFGRPNH